MTQKFIIPHKGIIRKQDRKTLNSHKSAILWFTGLSCAGKSTLAYKIEEELFKRELRAYVLDGDNVRTGLNKDLGFSAEDREENIRRIGEVAKLFIDAGLIIMVAFISHYQKDREFVRSIVEDDEFIEVYIKCSLEVCEQRDVKGFYKKARAGIIKNFTGIDDPYEEPEHPEIIVETDEMNIDESVEKIVNYLEERGYIDKWKGESILKETINIK